MTEGSNPRPEEGKKNSNIFFYVCCGIVIVCVVVNLALMDHRAEQARQRTLYELRLRQDVMRQVLDRNQDTLDNNQKELDAIRRVVEAALKQIAEKVAIESNLLYHARTNLNPTTR